MSEGITITILFGNSLLTSLGNPSHFTLTILADGRELRLIILCNRKRMGEERRYLYYTALCTLWHSPFTMPREDIVAMTMAYSSRL